MKAHEMSVEYIISSIGAILKCFPNIHRHPIAADKQKEVLEDLINSVVRIPSQLIYVCISSK